jgi:hypothetical protein
MDTDTLQPAIPKRHRWFQFRLRTMMIAVVGFGAVASFAVHYRGGLRKGFADE